MNDNERGRSPGRKHPALDRNIVLERFAASVATGWFASYPDTECIENVASKRYGTAKAILDIGEALTDEFMRRIGQ